jgi:hypothetical protein
MNRGSSQARFDGQNCGVSQIRAVREPPQGPEYFQRKYAVYDTYKKLFKLI